MIKFRQRHIFPGRLQPSIFCTGELNFCVRNGNRCDLSVIVTRNINLLSGILPQLRFHILLSQNATASSRSQHCEQCCLTPSKLYNDNSATDYVCYSFQRTILVFNHLTFLAFLPIRFRYFGWCAPSCFHNLLASCFRMTARFCKQNLWSSPRPISIGQLNVLPHLHLRPINLVVYKGSYPYRWDISS